MLLPIKKHLLKQISILILVFLFFSLITYSKGECPLKQFVFSINSEEIIVNSNSILEAVEQVKLILIASGIDRVQWKNLKFVGIKY